MNLVKGWWPVGFPWQGPIILKAFPCHDVIYDVYVYISVLLLLVCTPPALSLQGPDDSSFLSIRLADDILPPAYISLSAPSPSKSTSDKQATSEHPADQTATLDTTVKDYVKPVPIYTKDSLNPGESTDATPQKATSTSAPPHYIGDEVTGVDYGKPSPKSIIHKSTTQSNVDWFTERITETFYTSLFLTRIGLRDSSTTTAHPLTDQDEHHTSRQPLTDPGNTEHVDDESTPQTHASWITGDTTDAIRTTVSPTVVPQSSNVVYTTSAAPVSDKDNTDHITWPGATTPAHRVNTQTSSIITTSPLITATGGTETAVTIEQTNTTIPIRPSKGKSPTVAHVVLVTVIVNTFLVSNRSAWIHCNAYEDTITDDWTRMRRYQDEVDKAKNHYPSPDDGFVFRAISICNNMQQ